jgi:hypothetical protein
MSRTPSIQKARPAFDALIAATRFSTPNTGARSALQGVQPVDPRGTSSPSICPRAGPVLAPTEVALLFANGPPQGIWSDNLLVLAHPHRNLDLGDLAKDLPARLRQEDPGCEVLSCQVVPQGKAEALETVVRTRRGPFSMTVIERRFRGGRLDYEVKYTVESQPFRPCASSVMSF